MEHFASRYRRIRTLNVVESLKELPFINLCSPNIEFAICIAWTLLVSVCEKQEEWNHICNILTMIYLYLSLLYLELRFHFTWPLNVLLSSLRKKQIMMIISLLQFPLVFIQVFINNYLIITQTNSIFDVASVRCVIKTRSFVSPDESWVNFLWSVDLKSSEGNVGWAGWSLV